MSVVALVAHPFASPDPELVASEGAQSFLDEYVDADGRVLRPEAGGDTVSEGQGYALLLAVVAGDEERFESIWTWTRETLRRDDGLLAWHWREGGVVDWQMASDADVEVAWALLLGAERFDRPKWQDEALALGAAILDQATVESGGQLVLAAGPWATGDPAVINPSYFVLTAFEALGRASADERWEDVGHSSRVLLEELTERGQRLPPDWALLWDGVPELVERPDGNGSGRYGMDAARVPLRLASSCSRQDRALAAELWGLIHTLEDRGARTAYGLDGQAQTEYQNALGLVAAAASASAAGEAAEAEALLERAEGLAEEHPSYYGDAWVALGRALLTTSMLAECPGPLTRGR